MYVRKILLNSLSLRLKVTQTLTMEKYRDKKEKKHRGKSTNGTLLKHIHEEPHVSERLIFGDGEHNAHHDKIRRVVKEVELVVGYEAEERMARL